MISSVSFNGRSVQKIISNQKISLPINNEPVLQVSQNIVLNRKQKIIIGFLEFRKFLCEMVGDDLNLRLCDYKINKILGKEI